VAAGDFAAWLSGMRAALRGSGTADVPCAGCTACCRSSQFVLIEADEHDTLGRIPAGYLSPAPLMPEGNVVLGYRADGSCPMLGENGCSIYEFRPRACRSYDCRVLTACGLDPDGEARAELARRVQRWRFSFSSAPSRSELAALQRAAAFLGQHAEVFPDGRAPDVTQLAAMAVTVADLFLGAETDPDPDLVRGGLARRAHRTHRTH
jgi:Fe-S-cluster containining protein